MVKKTFFALLIIGATFKTFAQQAETSGIFDANITVENAKRHLSVLTSDSLEGREMGKEGNNKAARYIARQFEQLGLKQITPNNSYFQSIVFSNEGWDNAQMTVNGQLLQQSTNFYAIPGRNPLRDDTLSDKDIVFLGYGIDDAAYSDYKGRKFKHKIIVIYTGEPLNADSTSVITKTKTVSNWTTNDRKKIETAYKKGVKAIIFIDTNYAKNFRGNRSKFSRNITGNVENSDSLVNNLYISQETAFKIFREKNDKRTLEKHIAEHGKLSRLKLSVPVKLILHKYLRQLKSQNVLGLVEGSDSVLKNEYVIISAHYDHLGKQGDKIYHGADDNGSGTTGVLCLAQALMDAKRAGKNPKRSILLMLMSGEEKGLLGSKYYTTYPILPLAQTVADINIDMIGRIDEIYKTDPNYIYVIGSDKISKDLDTIVREVNDKFTHLKLDYTYNNENDPNRYYYRSDHYNFAVQGIPVVFYFNGTHADYHQPTDTYDKINFERLITVAKLAFHTAWSVADKPERLRIDKKL